MTQTGELPREEAKMVFVKSVEHVVAFERGLAAESELGFVE